jgi:hypothetical protein
MPFSQKSDSFHTKEMPQFIIFIFVEGIPGKNVVVQERMT